MEPFTTLTGRLVAIPADHIDTDQIIPARFLKTISKAGLGQNLFADWRYDEAGQPNPNFPLNRPENAGALMPYSFRMEGIAELLMPEM